MTDPDPPRPESARTESARTESARTGSAVGSEPGEPVLDAEPHDPNGLGLARTVARAVGAQTRRIRRRNQSYGDRPDPLPPSSSGARPDDRDPQLLQTAIDRLIDSRGWSTEVSVQLLLSRWPALVGTANAEHSFPEKYADTVLTVRADSTVWATSLRSIAPRLVAILNDQLGQGTVTRVQVLGPEAPSWKHGRRSVQGRGPRDTYG